jgi:hypothetical protein
LTEKVSPEGERAMHHFEPTDEIKDLLEKLMEKTPLALNAAALVDPHGNLLLTRADRYDISPINTALFNLISDYS